MEGIHMLRDLLKKDDFLVKIDLKDAYLTVPICKNHQKYLRFLWKGTMMEFRCLPFGLATAPRKLRKIRKKCQGLLDQGSISVRELSKFLGLLTSSIQAIFPAPIHYRHLQRLKNITLSSQKTYEALVALDLPAREEILWWRNHLHAWNGRALFQDNVDLIIETDASQKGWGAYCEGVRTGGPWSFKEKKYHINCLELLAGSLAIKTFTKSRVCAHVRLLMDNASAVAYINKMGGTHSQALANLAIDLWEWCFQNQLVVSAQHLPGYLNVRADQESRVIQDSSDWKLDPSVFQILLT
ncbi:uncharacterized protein LOC114540170 [Dendronephthya gigantea]|uniref:uncharacterized protein LOC114540170 n=1 Tax=Dendronephthya gigantea TaxID=151771 RepID=UPI00106A8F48|nr:uncharacterized protein LOC114540170 [Dendronephthya gigantea]